jgi:hypothetical protein
VKVSHGQKKEADAGKEDTIRSFVRCRLRRSWSYANEDGKIKK